MTSSKPVLVQPRRTGRFARLLNRVRPLPLVPMPVTVSKDVAMKDYVDRDAG